MKVLVSSILASVAPVFSVALLVGHTFCSGVLAAIEVNGLFYSNKEFDFLSEAALCGSESSTLRSEIDEAHILR